MATASSVRREQAALITFLLWLTWAAAVLLWIGRGTWTAVDDWMLSAPRDWADPASLLRDHNQHFSLVPVVIYKTLFSLFGFTDYWPYRVLGVGIHLSLVVVVRLCIRRVGVGPWMATATAGCLALFNGGGLVLSQFQMPLGLLLGLGAVLVAMRSRVGAVALMFGIGLGLLAIASSGVALPVVGAAGIIAWRRHGLIPALMLTGPVGIVYVAWWLWDSPQDAGLGPWQRSPAALGVWVVRGLAGTFGALAGAWVLAVVLAIAVGVGLLTSRQRGSAVRSFEPVVLAGAAAVLLALTYFGRGFDPMAVTQPRFLYLSAALLLPLVAVGWHGLALQRPAWGTLIAFPLAFGVVLNVQALRSETEATKGLLNWQRVLVAGMLRSPAAKDTPDWVRPWWSTGFFGLGDTTWGYLRDAEARGLLRLDDVPVPAEVASAALLRLRLVQLGEAPTGSCRLHSGPVVRTLATGTRIGFRGGGSPGQSAVNARLAARASGSAGYFAGPTGDTILVVGADPGTGRPLRIEFSAAEPGAIYYLCE